MGVRMTFTLDPDVLETCSPHLGGFLAGDEGVHGRLFQNLQFKLYSVRNIFPQSDPLTLTLVNLWWTSGMGKGSKCYNHLTELGTRNLGGMDCGTTQTGRIYKLDSYGFIACS